MIRYKRRMKIVYAVKVTDRSVAHHAADKVFIENDKTDGLEMRAALAATFAGVTVVLVTKNIRGVRVQAIKAAFEANGGQVVVDRGEPAPAAAAGRKAGLSFTPEQVAWACALWRDPSRTKEAVLRRIADETGQVPTRDQMNYLCLRRNGCQC